MRQFNSFAFQLLVVGLLLAFSSCKCVTCDDDDGGSGPTTEDQPWTDTGLDLGAEIIGVEATSAELLVFTPNRFIKSTSTNEGLETVESRIFSSRFRTLGQPAVHRLAFARGLRETATSAENLEFQLTQIAGDTRRFVIDSLTPELIALEQKGENIGAFNDDGTVYVQPVILRSSRTLGVLFFSLSYSPTFDEFDDVEFVGMVELPNVAEDDQVVSSLNFINDNFYLGTKYGGYRLSEGAVVTQVIPTSNWVRDIFSYQGDLYATRNSTSAVLKSTDGINFSPDVVGEYNLVTRFGDQFLSQTFKGWPYQLRNGLDDMSSPLLLNDDFPASNSMYFGISELNGAFYLGVGDRLWSTSELKK